MSVFSVHKRHESIEIVVSSNAGLSSMSIVSREAILGILKTSYHNVRISLVNNQQDLDVVVLRKPDLVFLGMKFVPTEPELGITDPNKIWLTECLQNAGIPYTGSGRDANELEFNKQLAKQRIVDHGLGTANYMVVEKGGQLEPQDVNLTYPLFVKPLDRGGGAGISDDSLVHSFEQLKARVTFLSENLRADSLIEEYLPGREFSVGILKHEFSDEYTAMPLEIVAPKNHAGERFLSSSIKSADTEHTLEINDPILKARVSSLGLKAFRALGAVNYGRIDIRLDAAGEPHFLEANLLPSLIENYGNFPKTCMLNLGLSHKDLILRLVELSLETSIELPDKADSEFVTPLVPDLADLYL